MTPFRGTQIYVRSSTRRQLKAIAGNDITVDELADNILRETIKERYPKVAELQSRIENLEELMIAEARK